MRIFLDDFIQTLTGRRQERVSTVLEEAKIGKSELNLVAERLAAFKDFAPLIITTERLGEKIVGNRMALNFRDIDVQMGELYRVTNLVSDLLNSNVDILSGQVKALEDEVIALTKMAENYAFLLADGGVYNYAYLEPFNDETGRDSLEFDIPDRASQSFGPAEKAEVRSDEGVLALSQNIVGPIAMSGTIIDSNASAAVITNNGIQNALSSTPDRGWRYVVASPNPISSTISGALDRKGAQINVEFLPSTPSPASEVKIVPFAEHPIEVVRVIAYTDALSTADSGVDLLEEPTLIDRPFALHFPACTIGKLRIIFNQPTYERVVDAVNPGEQLYRVVLEEQTPLAPQQVPDLDSYERGCNRRDFNRLSAFIRTRTFGRRTHTHAVESLPNRVFDATRGPMRILDVLRRTTNHARRDQWQSNVSVVMDLISRYADSNDGMIHTLPFNYASKENKAVPPFGRKNRGARRWKETHDRGGNDILRPMRHIQKWNSETRPLDPLTPTVVISPNGVVDPVATFSYTYYLGVENISVGMSSPTSKGVFVSKPYDCEGDIGTVRIKTAESNPRLSSNKDNNVLTSVEYSVSNVSGPSREQDWIPILPIGLTEIESERFFPDSIGNGRFRFAASRSEPIYVYRNGMKLTLATTDYIFDGLSQTILGVRLPIGETSSVDVFTASYTPSHDFTTINFADAGFSDLPLITAYDSTGPGEAYEGTGGRNIIDLAHIPYIDEGRVQLDLEQNTSNYQPITVVLRSGAVGMNITKYSGGAQQTLPAPPTTMPVYINSGRSIIFNDTITEPFRVYYQYLQNNVRTRVVLRVNDKTFISPKVDYVHLKAQTRRANRSGTMQ